MTQNIKNFIEEGENQFYGAYTFRFDDGIENADMIGKAKNVWNWHKQRQISLIKMIVEEYTEQIKKMLKTNSAYMFPATEERFINDLDTISSKLKEQLEESRK